MEYYVGRFANATECKYHEGFAIQVGRYLGSDVAECYWVTQKKTGDYKIQALNINWQRDWSDQILFEITDKEYEGLLMVVQSINQLGQGIKQEYSIEKVIEAVCGIKWDYSEIE